MVFASGDNTKIPTALGELVPVEKPLPPQGRVGLIGVRAGVRGDQSLHRLPRDSPLLVPLAHMGRDAGGEGSAEALLELAVVLIEIPALCFGNGSDHNTLPVQDGRTHADTKIQYLR